MHSGTYVLAYDIGTTANKTCLFEVSTHLRLVDSAMASYPLVVLEDGGAEQRPEDWWEAMCTTTATILERTGVARNAIKAISFCCQMQGLVLVDEEGMPVRPAMSYMDQRAIVQYARGMKQGLKVSGLNARALLQSLYLTGGASASVKDPVWKYQWVKEQEPDRFARVHRWLDVKEYLLHRSTGRFCMTEDSAHVTFLYNTRAGKGGWSSALCKLFGVNLNHLPDVVSSTERVGALTGQAAEELDLAADTPVFGGGGDLSCIALGSGAVSKDKAHIYVGTSGWVSAVTQKRTVDINNMMASIQGARPGHYNFIGEQETSGKCLEWVKDHLALDEIDIYLEKKDVTDDPDSIYTSLFDYLTRTIQEVPAGCDGVLFTPWLHGNRSPFEDPNARGMFFNISLHTGKRAMIRAVLEGIAFHKRWLLESLEAKVPIGDSVRFVGGGAQADVTCQILADITGKRIEKIVDPQNVGAAGAALICAKGLGLIDSWDRVETLVPVDNVFAPQVENKAVYDRNFAVFKNLYKTNRKSFRILNEVVSG